MEHLSLLLFSICLQAAIGIMVFVAIAKFMDKEISLKKSIIAAAILGIIGLVASFTHLGSPAGAMNALREFGSSWLSREIWLTSIFLGFTALALIASLIKKENLVMPLALVAGVVGLIDVYAMASIYSTTSVPAWATSGTVIEFFAAAISMGAIWFMLLDGAKLPKMTCALVGAVILAVIVQVAFVVPSYIEMGATSSTALTASLAILDSMYGVMVLKWLCILVGAVFSAIAAQKMSTGKAMPVAFTACALIFVGQILGRYLFYAMEVATSVGLF